jgi:hypothetical protein
MSRGLTRKTFVAALLLIVAGAHGASAQPASTPTEVVNHFYQAFSTSDFAAMESLYEPNVKWKDTVFSADNRAQLMGIWRFELAPSVGGKITYQVLGASRPDPEGNTKVHVRWRDVYKFFGNPIDHSIDATLTVDKNGKIVDHQENYSWSEWAHQAFPWLGGFVDNTFVASTMRWLLRRGVAGVVAYDDWKLANEPHEAAKSGGSEAAKTDDVRGPRVNSSGLLGRISEATDPAGEVDRK